MIVLNTTNQTTFALTLNEKSTLTGDTYYLFSFTNKETNVNKLFSITEQSSSCPSRYNRFTININYYSENLPNGKVNLKPGNYIYQVYESNTRFNLPSDLHISGTTGQVIEEGLVYIKPSFTSTDYDGNDNSEKVIYYGQ